MGNGEMPNSSGCGNGRDGSGRNILRELGREVVHPLLFLDSSLGVDGRAYSKDRPAIQIAGHKGS